MLRLLAMLLLVIPSIAMAAPPAVAVLYFDNKGNPELEPLKVGLAQMLVTDLTGTEGITVVERSRVQEILDELELGHSGKVDPATAAKVGSMLGARWLVMGNYFEVMGTLRIDARIVEVETSKLLISVGEDATTSAVFNIEKNLAAKLQAALAAAATEPGEKHRMNRGRLEPGGGGVDPTKPIEFASDRAGQPAAVDGTDEVGSTRQVESDRSLAANKLIRPDKAHLAAAVAFSEGLIALDRKDVTRAREAFEQALESHPDLTEAQAQLAALEL
jgi:TolB-like protein